MCEAEASKARRSDELMDIGGVISVQVLNELALISRRRYRLDGAFANARLQELRKIRTVVPLTLATHMRGVALPERYQPGAYDATNVSAALIAGCTRLFSEDLLDGLVIDWLTIRSPHA